MADLTITKQWPTGIRRVETTDPWVGGEDGTANIQAKQIGGALAYLKDFADEVQAARGAETSLSARIEKRGVDAQNILSKFAYIETVPVAASVEPIDVVKGGLLVIDGIKTKAGEVVFLKDQSDKKQNGFWEVQTGAWNRAAGYTAADTDCFTYKLITIDAGNTNKGRIYFLDDDSYKIGSDNLDFKEAAFSYEAHPGKALIRDRSGKVIDMEKGDADTLNSAKSYTDSLLIKIFQNGYIQWPGMPTPDTLFSFEGYRWAEVNYDGCFFRAKGKDAEAFDGDEQGDAIRNITGSFLQFPSFPADGCFTVAQTGTSASYNTGAGSGVIYFDASKVVPTAEENRPRNKTFIIWKLEKI